MSNQLLINGTALTLTPSTVQVTQPGAAAGAGGGGPVSIKYADLKLLKNNNNLVPDRNYLVTNRPVINLGEIGNILVKAVSVSELEEEAVLYAKVPDYVAIPLWIKTPSSSSAAYSRVISAYTPIVPTGTVTTALDGDDALVRYDLPTGFDFQFGGIPYLSIGIDTNGRIGFTATQYGYGGNPLPYTQNSPSEPIIALAWGDLYPQPGQITYFTEGVAPNRKFVIQYTNVPMYGAPNFTITGQIVLEETTYVVSIGIGATNIPNYYTQGIQYLGLYDNLRADGILVPNQMATYSPPLSTTVVRTNATTVIWNGITWETTTGDLEEPGVDPIWTVASGGVDYGNTVSVYDEVRYSLVYDTITERRDRLGNVVITNSFSKFPWGSPKFIGNVLNTVILDNSLLNVKTFFQHNKLLGVTIQNVDFNQTNFVSNSFYFLTFTGYAPTAFYQNTVFYGFNTSVLSYINKFIINGSDVTAFISQAYVDTRDSNLQNQIYNLQNQINNSSSPITFGTGSGTLLKANWSNTANAYQSSVIAGESSTASGQYSTVVSGYINQTLGHWATIIGGDHNSYGPQDVQAVGIIMASVGCNVNSRLCLVSNSSNCTIAQGHDNTTLIGCSGLNITTGSNQTYINNQLYAPITLTPSAVKTALINGTFSNGFFNGTNPASSKPGMVFTGGSIGNSNTYKYEYTLAPSDTTGTTFAWCRMMLS